MLKILGVQYTFKQLKPNTESEELARSSLKLAIKTIRKNPKLIGEVVKKIPLTNHKQYLNGFDSYLCSYLCGIPSKRRNAELVFESLIK